MDYISLKYTAHNYGINIRDLCYYRDSCDPHVPPATEIGYLCTIYIYTTIWMLTVNVYILLFMM